MINDQLRAAARTEAIAPFMVMEVLEAAQAIERTGDKVIHLEIGEPDFDTPEVIRAAGAAALAAGGTHYTHSLGRRELREAIAEHYWSTYRVAVPPERVIVTTGTSAGLWMAMAALIEPGDEVILGDPSYACYPNFIRFFGGIPRFVPLDPDDGYQFHLGEVEQRITPRTRAILINSPSNPTGTLLTAETLAALASTGLPILSDEIYHGLVYEGREHTMLEFAPDAIVLNGFSKAWAMTGWRLGWMIVPERLVRPIQKMAQNFFISAADFSQSAGVAALRHGAPEVARMRAEYDRRRRRMIAGLREIGFALRHEPTGAFYVLADARRWSCDSRALVFQILERARVACSPGVDFGRNAEGFLRFSYANSLDRIEEALRRLAAFFREYEDRTARLTRHDS
ncbi:MAG: pyridoxal phosphate-dependent aminotransferase [Dehalococcoidia bacterium]|nr:pyridoxal phosphate-dependent aminotransferase [Dehalococcoidia bacterium]